MTAPGKEYSILAQNDLSCTGTHKGVSYARNMGNHNQSLVLLKNFLLSHDTHWQQTYSIGKEWTF